MRMRELLIPVTLNIIIECTDLISVSFHQFERIVVAEIFELGQHMFTEPGDLDENGCSDYQQV